MSVYPSVSSYRKKNMIEKSTVIAMSNDAGPYGFTRMLKDVLQIYSHHSVQ